MPESLSSKYQPHIDGLRALAVLSVLFYHTGLPLPGGYVGVDIFFVISGFLITRLLRAELLTTGRISIRTFYLRRIRRLLPASFAVLGATAAACSILFSPHELVMFGRSLMAAIFSASNILFFLESGYFESNSALKPLLHTWSLSVEEQFYLIWPILLYVTFLKFGDRGAFRLTIALVCASVAINIAASSESAATAMGLGGETFGQGLRSAMFFLLPFRVYELGIGALVVWLAERRRPSILVRQILLVAGLCAIGVSFVTFTDETPIPSYYALVPCLGAACVIYSGDAPGLGTLLTNRISVALGKISYSLYLVHWPIISLTAYWLLRPLVLPESLCILALSLMLASFLYLVIEKPTRLVGVSGWRSVAAERITHVVGAAAAALAILSASQMIFQGWVWRLPIQRQHIYLAIKDPQHFNTQYYGGRGCRPRGELNSCEVNPTAQKTVYLIGDSHARHYIAGLTRMFPEAHLIVFDNRCRFNTLDLCYAGRWQQSAFHEIRKKQIAELRRSRAPIILAQAWYAFENTKYYDPSSDSVIEFGTMDEYVAFLVKQLRRVREALPDRPFVVIGQSNGFGILGDPLSCLGSPMMRGGCRSQLANFSVPFNAKLRRALADTGIGFVAPTDVTCDAQSCRTRTEQNLPLYSDTGHFSVWGSELVVQALRAELASALDIRDGPGPSPP